MARPHIFVPIEEAHLVNCNPKAREYKTFEQAANDPLHIDEACAIINGVRELPIRSVAPGNRFALVLSTGKRIPGTVVRQGPGTTAVVLDHAENERSFTTLEGTVVVLKKSGGVVYWSPGTPVLPLREPPRDVTRWTTAGGTGIGQVPGKFVDEVAVKSDEDEGEDSAMGEKVAGLPGVTAGQVKSSKKAKVAKVARVKVVKELHPCLCGCGDNVAGRFRQGHDGRYYSVLKKVAAGEMQFNEMPKAMQAASGNVAGVKKILAASKH